MRVKEGRIAVRFRLCPRCSRAVPWASKEQFCPNDGTRLLEVCPKCAAIISNPYARHCTQCGHELVNDTT
jgi:NADH pyrophosphatase NudC (nudix superfamily)